MGTDWTVLKYCCCDVSWPADLKLSLTNATAPSGCEGNKYASSAKLPVVYCKDGST